MTMINRVPSARPPSQNRDPTPNLPPYNFLKFLGSGSYAKVYKASLTPSKLDQVEDPGKRPASQMVAIKCILRNKVRSKSAADILVNEISVLQKLRHPHIVEMLTFSWDPNYIYIVMEYCAWGDFQRWIDARKGKVLESQAKYYFRQLADAMCYLSSQNIAHFDLKPKNLLLTHRRRLKVADFGFALFLSSPESEFSLRGTPLYMAPEIVKNAYRRRERGERSPTALDPRADLWSCGVILYEIMFGLVPILHSSLDCVLEQLLSIKHITLPKGKGLSAECEDLLKRLLQVEPDNRMLYSELEVHPFVDLETYHNYNSARLKADDCFNFAKELEFGGKLEGAIDLYVEGVKFLLDFKQYVDNPEEKNELTKEMYHYTERAEKLRKSITLNGKDGAKIGAKHFVLVFAEYPELLKKHREASASYLRPLLSHGRYEDCKTHLISLIDYYREYLRAGKLKNEEQTQTLLAEIKRLIEYTENLVEEMKLYQSKQPNTPEGEEGSSQPGTTADQSFFLAGSNSAAASYQSVTNSVAPRPTQSTNDKCSIQ